MTLKPGDQVEFNGHRGRVSRITKGMYPIHVKFTKTKHEMGFKEEQLVKVNPLLWNEND